MKIKVSSGCHLEKYKKKKPKGYKIKTEKLGRRYMISNNQIAKVLCIACQDTIGEHSKRQLWRCLFRVQGTIVSAKLEERLPTTDKSEPKINARH